MEYYNLIITKEILNPETNQRTWNHDLVLSKIFSSQKRAVEYWETWKKANDGFLFNAVTEEHLYYHVINKVSLDSDTEDGEIDDLMYESRRYYVGVDYYAPNTKYNNTGIDKYQISTSGIISCRTDKINEINFELREPGYISIHFCIESTPASIRIDSEEKVDIIVKSPWLNKIKDLTLDCNPTQRWIKVYSDDIKQFMSGNFRIDSSAKAVFENGQGKFV